jgi:LysM repeat protein
MAISPQRLLLVLLCLFSELSNTLAFTSFSTNSRGSSSWASGGHALVGNERGRVVIVSVGRKKDAEPAPSPQTPAAPAAAKKAPAKKADAVAPVAAAAATGGVPGEAPAKAPRAPAPPLVKKADFLAIISEKTGLTKKDSESALDAIFDTITEVRKKVLFDEWQATWQMY